MASYNRVMLMGNLVRDPELRYTPAGMAVAEFAIAVNRQWSSKTGEKKEEVSFFDIEVWARQAETCAEYLKKGRPVFVEGRLTQKRWETPEGQKRNRVVITGDRVVFLGSGGGGTGRGPTAAPAPDSQDAPPPEVSDAPPPPEDDVPF